MMIDWVSPPAGMRPLSLIRPSAWPCGKGRQRLTAAWRELAAVVPIGESGCGGPGRAGGHVLVTMVRVSGRGGERVVAELGQDVMGLAEDLAGLGQAGALAVVAVLHLGVVAVVRC
jgi:hypothetical protein